MTKLKQLLLSLILLAVPVVAPLALTSGAQAQVNPGCLDDTGNPEDCLRGGACIGDDCLTENADDRVSGMINTIINIFSVVVGVVSVIMIIVGGFKYITSGGDSGNVSSAKNTILYAIVGLIIVALAQVIVQFVLNRATSE